MHFRIRSAWLPILVVCVADAACSALSADDSASVREQFARPSRQFATGPLWVWNDMLTEGQVRGTLRDLAGQGVRQAFVHPRPGLMTPYLSEEWFRLWKAALDEAEKLDVNLWIYDENSYPSGFAGGWVPEQMPESRGRGLHFSEVDDPGKPADDVVGVFLLKENSYEKVGAVNNRVQPPPANGKYLVASVARAGNSPWHGNRAYVDLLYPGVTEKFLEVTIDPYRRRFGDQFGKRIPGSFTDEPNIAPAGGLPWTDRLPEEFQKRWGYSLVDHLPSLVRPLGDWKKVRHDYYQVLLDQFIEHWAKPYSEYCEKNHLQFTGHYWDHNWPDCLGVPDNMAMYAWHQRPAIDCLMNQYAEHTHAQFGNVRMVKELSSVANQLGRKRTLCETYGAGGWDLRLEDMKRIGDWVSVLGVNTIDEHLSYVTIRGARKRDHPQSFSYHEPWWDAYHVLEEYFTRLSLVLSSGEEINRILVIEPTTTVWMYQADPSQQGKLEKIGKSFFDFCLVLSKAQVEYDLGCEDVIARHGSITKKTDRPESSPPRAYFTVGKRDYHAVLLPPMTETLNDKTMSLLEEFTKNGGRVVCGGEPPVMVDARPSPRGKALSLTSGWEFIHTSPGCLEQEDQPCVIPWEDSKGILFHQRRRVEDGDFCFLVNTSITEPVSGRIIIPGSIRSVEQWNLFTGTTEPYPFEGSKDAKKRQDVDFSLAPGGSLLLFLSEKSVPETKKTLNRDPRTLMPQSPPEIKRLEPNVLTIDYVDVTAGGETLKNVYFYRANQFAFQKNGLPRNPWDSAVQFRDEILKHQFPADSGFEATYRFTIEDKVPAGLEIVIERPDLYKIECNGKPVTALKDAWWLDKAFGRIDLTQTAQVGENTVTIRARPMTLFHEIEPAYLRGDFNLKPAASGFVVVPPQPLTLGKTDAEGWNAQGHPFYSAGVGYREKFNLPELKGNYYVRLPRWYGSVARVNVNGELAGYVTHQPWQCDVTKFLKPGENEVEVVVIGTLKNLLGPHHVGPVRGSAWPGMFQQGPPTGPPPGKNYDTIGYGLFEPFVLEQQ
ncbi:MAG: hypothetical protein JXB10_00635 [Pirellulales bacterium]|nr:hypothetical protein [Pirellulales bacterium]